MPYAPRVPRANDHAANDTGQSNEELDKRGRPLSYRDCKGLDVVLHTNRRTMSALLMKPSFRKRDQIP
jgi:hypothetical protein